MSTLQITPETLRQLQRIGAQWQDRTIDSVNVETVLAQVVERVYQQTVNGAQIETEAPFYDLEAFNRGKSLIGTSRSFSGTQGYSPNVIYNTLWDTIVNKFERINRQELPK